MYDLVMSRRPTPIGSPDGPGAVDIEHEISEIAGALNLINSRLVKVAERALERGEWIGHGIHSPAQWLAWKAGMSPQHAKQIVQIAEQRASFPLVIDAFDRGELTVDQVHVVVTRAPAWADDRVLHFTKNASVVQLRRAIRAGRFEGDPDQPDPEPRREDRERLSTGNTDQGRWRINGELDIERGSIVDNALSEARDSLFEQGHTDATWADALVEIAQRSLDAVAAESRRERFKTWVHLSADTGDATLTAGWRIPMAVRDRVLCDGQIQPVWERDGVPFSVGRSQRIVPDRTRRIVEHRDRGCRVPGCTADRFVEIHHIIHWLNDGPTDTWNLICLCPKHHRMHHQGRLGITGNADQKCDLTFTDWQGRAIDPAGQPILPTGPPPQPVVPYQHPCGERMDLNWVGLGWAHDNALKHRRQQARQRSAADWMP